MGILQFENKTLMIKNTALVLEGGGFRGIFTAGILEVFLKEKLFFEAVFGISAGASYGASYLSEQKGRNLEVNTYIGDPRYFGLKHLIRKGSLFSWEFIFEDMPQNLVPFDYQTLKNSESQFYVGTSNCLTGASEFFLLNKTNKKDFKTLLSASSSLPLIAPIVSYENLYLLDGGLADSIPFEYALKQGFEKAVVILTQPTNYKKEPLKYPWLFKWYYRKHPKVYEMLLTRSERYNTTIRKLEQLEQEGTLFVIRPQEKLSVSRLENNPKKTAHVFSDAMALAEKELPRFQKWLKQ